ncbi:MAG: hypothetical protein JWN85_92 [Gammaproteobacteria bacterium]|nr:hypothetical protein [Gammaproteobacteria bacterium]
MRKSGVLAALVVMTFMTAGMGLPLLGEGGKFSASNIMPVVFTAIAAVFFFRARNAVDRRLLWSLLLFNVACFTSFVLFLARFAWDPNFFVLLFQDLSILFCVLLWWYADDNPAEFRRAVRAGIFWSLPVAAVFAWYDSHTGAPWLSFGMDDKSQAAVLMACEAYILIRFFGGKLDRVVGVGLYVATYLTVSRLPVFFLPAILLALMRGSRYAAAITTVGVCLVVSALVIAGDAIKAIFGVYDRLASVEAVTDSGSTSAHLLLLKTALQIKFSDPMAFLFGIGPGNFSKALTSFPVSVAEIEAIDPQLVAFAREGKAPLHSMPMQILLDYTPVVFFLFVYFVLRVFRFLARRRNLADLTFFFGFLAASTFYSLHNKPYFYLVATTAALLILQEVRSVEEEPDASLESDGDIALRPTI